MPQKLVFTAAIAAALFLITPLQAGASLLTALEGLARAGEAAGTLEHDAAAVETLDRAALAAGAVATGAGLAEHTTDLSKGLVILAPDGDNLYVTSNLVDRADAKPAAFQVDPQSIDDIPLPYVALFQSFPTEQAISNAGSEELMTALHSATTQTKYMVALDAMAHGKLGHIDLTSAENVWFVDRNGQAWRQVVLDGRSMAQLTDGVVADPTVAYSPLLYQALTAQPIVGANCSIGCDADIGTLVGAAKQYVSGGKWLSRGLDRSHRKRRQRNRRACRKQERQIDDAAGKGEGLSPSSISIRWKSWAERIKDLYEKGDDAKDILSSVGGQNSGVSEQNPSGSSGSPPSIWMVVLIGLGILVAGSIIVGIVKGIASD